MATYTHRELTEHSGRQTDELDKLKQEVQKRVENFETSADISKSQGEPVLQEQAEQLNQLNAKLGEIGMEEVEAAVEQAEAQCEAMQAHEQGLEQAAGHERQGAERIAAGRTRVDSQGLDRTLAEQQAVREQGAEVLAREKARIEGARVEAEEETRRMSERSRAIRQSLKNF